jgi:hypothetical protein
LPEIERTCTRNIKQPVEDHERPAIGHIIGPERPVSWEAVSQPPSDEQWLSDLVNVGESSAVRGHESECSFRCQILTGIRKRG